MSKLGEEWDALEAPSQAPVASNLAAQWDAIPNRPAPIKGETPSPLGTNWENAFAGAGKAVVDAGRGAKQIMDMPSQWLEKKFPGISAWASEKGMPTAQQSANATNADVAESKRLDAPLMDTKAGISGNIAGSAATVMLPLGIAAKGGSMVNGASTAAALLNPTTYTAAAASGALSGAIQPVTDDESRVKNMGLGMATGAAGNLAVNTIGRVAQPIANVLSSAHAKAVRTLESAGIPLDAAQKTGSSFLNKVRSSFSDNPFTSGTQGELVMAQKQGYNKAVLATIGENANAATSDVMDSASKRINGVFKDVLDRNNIAITDPIVSKIGAIQAAANEEEKSPVVAVANRIIASVKDDGTIPGQIAYSIKKDLERYASSADTGLAYHARQLRSTLMDAINDSLSTADKAAFSEARNQFGNMKKMESAIDKTGKGDISAPILANVMAQKSNRGASLYGRGNQELVDLAHAGNMLLPDKAPNSGTVARGFVQAIPALLGAGAGGAYSGDWEGAAKGALGFAVLPKAAQYLMNNPATSNYLANGMQGSMTPIRQMLQAPQTNPAIGGLLRRFPVQSNESFRKDRSGE